MAATRTSAHGGPSRRYDLIYSNAALHWLPNHATLFPRCHGEGRTGRHPCGADAAQFHRALACADRRDRAERSLAQQGRASGHAAAGRRARLLSRAACRRCRDNIDIWETEYLQVLEGDNPVKEWTKGTWLTRYLDILQGDEKAAFEAAYGERVAKAYPKNAAGQTLFPFRRLFMVAQRKALTAACDMLPLDEAGVGARKSESGQRPGSPEIGLRSSCSPRGLLPLLRPKNKKTTGSEVVGEVLHAQTHSWRYCGRLHAGARRRIGRRYHRHQVQPRRRQRHAEGQGRAQVQGACREVHQRQGQDRGLSELLALQGQGRDRGAATRLGADAGAVDREVRAARRQGIRGARPALAVQGRRDLFRRHEGRGRQVAVQEARGQGHHRSRLIGTTAST